MAIHLTDDGTLDTVLRCDGCGREFRGNYATQYDQMDRPECTRHGKVACEPCMQGDYQVWVAEFIADVEAEHQCSDDDDDDASE